MTTGKQDMRLEGKISIVTGAAPGIGCNAVWPGFIAPPIRATIPDKARAQMTERVPMKRLGRPEEGTDVYAYLASEEASHINGAVIEVAGGLTV